MLDHRVVTLHPKIHGGILADRGKESHLADLETHGIAPFDLVVSNLYPFADQPDIETIDIGGPAMVRAAAKNHAWVGIVTSPTQYGAGARRAAAPTERCRSDDAPRARTRSVREHRGVRRRDRRVALGLTTELPQHLVLPLERTDEQLRYGENPHQAGGALPAAGHDELVGRHHAAQWSRARATSTSTTPKPRGSSYTTWVSARRSRSSSTRTRVVSRSPTISRPRTAVRSSATSARRSAGSWR